MTRMSLVLGLVLLFGSVRAAESDPKSAPPPPLPPSAGNVVPGLALPGPQTVNYDDQFITVTATCKGDIQWLVLSTSDTIKYKIAKGQTAEIDVGIPPTECLITLFAVGLVDGKMTPFARTDITVKGPAPPGPAPSTLPSNIKLPLHLTIIEDPAKRTDAIKTVIESVQLRQQLQQKNTIMRIYVNNDPMIAAKKMDTLLTKYSLPLMVLQDSTGALVAQPVTLPATIDGVLTAVNQALGAAK